ESPIATFDRVAVAHHDVRREIPIATLLAARLTALAAGMRAEAIGRGASCGLEWRRCRRMVAMSVSHKNMTHSLAIEAREHAFEVFGEVRAGVDPRHLALADDIGAGAFVGERAGVAGDDAADTRRHRFEPAVFKSDLTPIGDLDSHGRFAPG